jgi:hypothetical protein
LLGDLSAIALVDKKGLRAGLLREPDGLPFS